MPELEQSTGYRKLPMDEHEILRIAGRSNNLVEAAFDLGVTHQTLKNWLSAYYTANDYSGLHQALYYEFIDPDDR